MKIFATSDQHYFHRNIIKYCNRPFDFNDENCVQDNAIMMIDRYNETIAKDDVALIVGDLSAGLKGRQESLAYIIRHLNGNKILIRGNHDHEPDQFYLDAGFLAVVNFIQIDKYFICHYPCNLTEYMKPPEKAHWMNMAETTEVVIHGHIHGNDPMLWENTDGRKRINVCVDFPANDFRPQELTDPIIKIYFENYINNLNTKT